MSTMPTDMPRTRSRAPRGQRTVCTVAGCDQFVTVRRRAERVGVELPRDGGIVWVRESDIVRMRQVAA